MIAKKSFNPEFGARPIKRFVQKEIETAVARELLKRDQTGGMQLKLSVENDAFKIS